MVDLIKKKTISSLFWKLFEKGGRSAVELIVQIVMARLLVPEQFGTLAILLVFVNIGNVIVQSGLNTGLIQVREVSKHDYSTVFWLSLFISLCLFVGVFFAAPTVADFYNMPGLVWPLRVLTVILFINAYNAVQIAKVTRELNLKKIFNATIISVFVSGAAGIAFAVADFGLWALVIQQLAYQLVNCIVLAIQVDWKPSFVFKPQRARVLFGFGWKLLVSGLMDVGYRSLSDLIIGKQFSTAQLGYVSQGKKYPNALGSMLDGAIQPVMLSAVAHIQDDIAYVKRLVRRALKTSTFLIVPAMTMFAVVAESLVGLLLGEQWLPAVPFLQMYCFIFALLPIHTTNLQALNGMGRSDLFLKLEIIKKSYGLAIIFFTAFVLKDVYLVVAGYMLSSIISTFVNAWPNKRVIGYGYLEQIKDIVPAFAMSALAAMVAFPIDMLGLPSLAVIAIQILVIGAIYLALAALFKVEALRYLVNTIKELVGSRKTGVRK